MELAKINVLSSGVIFIWEMEKCIYLTRTHFFEVFEMLHTSLKIILKLVLRPLVDEETIRRWWSQTYFL